MVFGTSAAFAGDYADLKFIGFSADGSYMAFEESGEWDGSGGSYATTYYIDVEKNKYAIKPSVFESDMDATRSVRNRLFAAYKVSVDAGLKRLNIVRGNTGKLVFARMLTDWTSVPPVEAETYWTKDGKETKKKMPNYEGAFLYRGDTPEKVVFNPWLYVNNFNTDSFYELNLKLTPAKSEACSDEAYKIEMTLQDNTHHQDVALQTLQKDNEIPKARHCPYGYHIEQVYFYKDKLAVFMNMFSQGFEGPDMRYMAVTGRLAYESAPPGE